MGEQYLELEVTPTDTAFSLMAQFEADLHPRKVSLIAGTYRDENGLPWILPSVKEAKARLREFESHEYLDIAGAPEFIKLSQSLVFGPELTTTLGDNIASIQTVSGTGANHMAAVFLAKHLPPRRVFIPSPTWINRKTIWASTDVAIMEYPYVAPHTGSVDIEGMLSFLEVTSEPNDVVILQPCAHNPTGVDLSRSQWSQVADIVHKNRLFVVFDNAYQGFASGNVDDDAWAMRYFLKQLMLKDNPQLTGFCVAQSFSKNFGLYGERVGALHLVAPPRFSTHGARSALINLARVEYSNPPRFGAKIVETILADERLRIQWQRDLVTMSSRIKDMRGNLRNQLSEGDTLGNWSHISSQIGMFSYTGLDIERVNRLRNEFHIYLLPSGRASICGLNGNNIEYVASAIRQV
ncbi:aspartate transaminase, partial [Aaosphaeria arxii CBS 175.79]